jgi:Ras GTPase-activating-like protein IQGAP2/3
MNAPFFTRLTAVHIDPRATEKAIWVQAKRGVLAVLRVQPAPNLVASLVEPVTEEHECLWEEIVENELVHDQARAQQQNHGRQPSAGVAESAYRLEDIRSSVLSKRDPDQLLQYLFTSPDSLDSPTPK